MDYDKFIDQLMKIEGFSEYFYDWCANEGVNGDVMLERYNDNVLPIILEFISDAIKDLESWSIAYQEIIKKCDDEEMTILKSLLKLQRDLSIKGK